VNRKILNLAVPNIISNITVPLLGIVDIALLGHLGSEVYIGAIAIGTVIFNFLYWGFGFLRLGTSGFTAQSYGERSFEGITNILGRAVFTALLASIVILILQKPIADLSFWIMKPSMEVEHYARTYFLIRVLAAPANLIMYAFKGWYIGMQNTRFVMIVTISINLLNILFSFIFIYALNMNVAGAALGTVLAQYFGLALSLFFFFRYYKRFIPYFDFKKVTELKGLTKFFNVNRDIFIRTVCLILAFSFFTTKSAQMDDTLLAVNTILLQFLMLFSYAVDGFAYAAEALSGRYYGAGNYSLLKKSVSYLFRWGIALGTLFFIIYLAGGDLILRMFTNNPDVLTSARSYFYWVLLVPVITFPAFIWDGVYIGVTASAAMRNAMLIATFLIFLPTFYLLEPYMGNHALWLAMMLFMIARGGLLTLLAKKSIFQPKLLKNENHKGNQYQ
jgi:multidrug resistance protein, MATE family